MKKYILLLLAVSFSYLGIAQQTGSILIKNGTVLTITNGTLEDTDVLIENGKIRKIGEDLSAAESVKVVDAEGMFVMPGIIDAHSHIALDVVNEGTSPSTADVWVGDALDPLDVSIYRALAGGVTISHAMHGSANAIGGQCETIKHRYGTFDPEEMRMVGAPRTIKFALGENPMRVHGEGRGILPRTRMGIEQVFRQEFSKGQRYMEAWDNYNQLKAKSTSITPPRYCLLYTSDAADE